MEDRLNSDNKLHQNLFARKTKFLSHPGGFHLSIIIQRFLEVIEAPFSTSNVFLNKKKKRNLSYKILAQQCHQHKIRANWNPANNCSHFRCTRIENRFEAMAAFRKKSPLVNIIEELNSNTVV